MSKKVLIIIVEGPSEEELLIKRLREIYFDQEILFKVYGGDIFDVVTDRNSVKSVIGDIVKTIIRKNKFKPSDILAIIHIMDTDGCFISYVNIVINSNQEVSTYYNLENITVNSSKQKKNIEIRNINRSRNVKIMNCQSSIIGKKYKYQSYYFSRNLEHVLFDDPNPAGESKTKNVEKFLIALNEPVEVFLENYLPKLTCTNYFEKYRESWTFIEAGINSLNRYNNIPLLLDFINLNLI